MWQQGRPERSPRPRLRALRQATLKTWPGVLAEPRGPRTFWSPGAGTPCPDPRTPARPLWLSPAAARKQIGFSQCTGRVRVPASPPPPSVLLGLDAVFLRPGRPWWKSLLSTGSPSQLLSHPRRISARNGNWLEQTSPLLRVREWKVRVGGSQAAATVPLPGWPVCLLGGS